MAHPREPGRILSQPKSTRPNSESSDTLTIGGWGFVGVLPDSFGAKTDWSNRAPHSAPTPSHPTQQQVTGLCWGAARPFWGLKRLDECILSAIQPSSSSCDMRHTISTRLSRPNSQSSDQYLMHKDVYCSQWRRSLGMGGDRCFRFGVKD